MVMVWSVESMENDCSAARRGEEIKSTSRRGVDFIYRIVLSPGFFTTDLGRDDWQMRPVAAYTDEVRVLWRVADANFELCHTEGAAQWDDTGGDGADAVGAVSGHQRGRLSNRVAGAGLFCGAVVGGAGLDADDSNQKGKRRPGGAELSAVGWVDYLS